MTSKAPYSGTLRKLVLAFDVGTTYSGIAYSILDPEEIPRVQGVTRFPGQSSGDFKIPSVAWYTQDGNVHTAGAEARDPGMELIAEDEDLILVEWFKLHLRPDGLDSDGLRKTDLKPLPPKKSVVQVFGDFLAYLFECAKRFIVETHPNGLSLWQSFHDRIDYVLTHPNGWEGLQQSKMRQAAVYGKLIPDTPLGHARIKFTSEGEASLLYCVDNGLAATAIEDDANIMIIDAGGGTVDISTYKIITPTPFRAEEISAPSCILQGSTRVNMRAQRFLKDKLRDSQYSNDEDIKTMMDCFERSTKPTFKDPSDRSFIKFGSMKDRDPAVGIRSGQLTLEGTEVEKFFEPSIEGIVSAVRSQRVAASEPVNLAFLVGGFAASPWLYERLKERLALVNMDLSRPDDHTNKAVAEGAVSFYLSNSVAARVARFTYGAECSNEYDPGDADHSLRSHKLFSRPSGRVLVPDAFDVILAKGTKLRDNTELRRPYYQESTRPNSLNNISSDVVCYRGKLNNPLWTDMEPECFSALCTVYADTSRVKKEKHQGTKGVYYSQNYDLVLSCGSTEMKAQICWMENGQEKRGNAKIVYDDDVESAS